MKKTELLFVIGLNGEYLETPSQTLTGNNKNSAEIVVLSQAEIDTTVEVSYYLRNNTDEVETHYLIPSTDKGAVYSDNVDYADYNVFKGYVSDKAYELVSNYRGGQVEFAIAFSKIQTPYGAKVDKGYFDRDNLLPTVADEGDFYVSQGWNFTDKGINWAYGDYAYYKNGKFRRSNYKGLFNTESIPISISPNVYHDKEVEETSLDEIIIGKVGVLENDVDTNKTAISDNKDDILEHEGRISANEDKNVEQDNRITAHIEDVDNPHAVTAEQVDTYIKTAIDDKDSNTLQAAKDYTYSQVEIDNKDTTIMNKANNLENANMFKDVVYNNVNGVLTFTKYDDTTKAIDLPLELIVTSGYYDEVANELVLVLANSSEIRMPVGNLLTDLDAHNIRFNGSGTNYLVNKQDVESAVKELDTQVKDANDDIALKVNTSDIVNNLTSTDTNKPLSANQGKVLNDTKADQIDTYNKAEVDNLLYKLRVGQSLITIDRYPYLEMAWNNQDNFVVNGSGNITGYTISDPQVVDLVIPYGVTVIPSQSKPYDLYGDPNNMQSLTISDGVRYIFNHAFDIWRSNNQPLVIPDSVTFIGNEAFGGWSSNNQPLVIPDSVTSIGIFAFSNWTSNNQPLVIPDSITSIKMRAFNGWTSNNQKLIIPDSITSIDDGGFFYWTSNNQPLVIPNSVTSIKGQAFRYWESNSHPLVIPESVTSIGYAAFRNWLQVPEIIVEAVTPPSLGTVVFDDTNNAPIYVPDESVNDYKTATNWIEYADRIFPMSDLNGGV